MPGLKKSNNYSEVIGDHLYAAIPKAVLAAVVVSLLSNGGDHFEDVEAKLVEEWGALHVAGIVPQRPPKAVYRALAAGPERSEG